MSSFQRENCLPDVKEYKQTDWYYGTIANRENTILGPGKKSRQTVDPLPTNTGSVILATMNNKKAPESYCYLPP